MSRDRAPVVDLCCSSPPAPAAKRPRTERKGGAPRVRDMHDEIVDLSLMDSPDPVVEQRGQLAQAQAGRGHRLWGELPSAEAGCDAHEADDSAQLLQPRARRSRRPYVPPSTAASAPAAQQPQQPAQRHWQLPRPGKLDEEDGVSDDELILLGSGHMVDAEAAAPQRPATNSRRRQFMPPQQLLAGAAPQAPVSPPRANFAAERAGRRFGSAAHKAQQDAELACRLQAQEQIAVARERQRARFQAQQQQVQQAYMQRHMEQLASLEAAAAEAAAARAAAGSSAQQRGGRGGLGNWSDGGSNEDEDDPWSNAADDAVFGGRPPWAVFGSEDASPPRRGGRGARRSHTSQRSGPRGSRHRPDWGSGGSASSLADAMLGMLSETGSWGGMQVAGAPGLGHLHMQPQPGLGGGGDYSSVGGALAAMRAAMSGLTAQSRLPPSMLFSDRDFTADDYEALLALDEGIDNRKGASKEVIEAIPTVTVGGSGGGLTPDDDPRCCICLADYAPGATLRKLPCGHQFHRACLDTWLAQKATCPICQAAAAAGGGK